MAWSNPYNLSNDILSRWNATGSGGPPGEQDNIDRLNQYAQIFNQTYKNLAGTDAPADALTNYLQNAAWQQDMTLPGQSTYGDVSGLASSYIQNTFPDAVTAYQKQQQAQTNTDIQKQITDLINQQMQQSMNQLTNPETAEQLKRAYNNVGLTNSGAFEQGLGNTLANAAAGNIANSLGAFSLPAFSSMYGLSTAPYANSVQNTIPFLAGQSALSNQYTQFNMQSQLAKQLQEMSAPGWAEKYAVPLGSAALQGAGSAASKGATAGSYVCRELTKLGLLCEMDIDDLHAHLVPAIPYKARAVWLYAKNGQKVVEAANIQGINWAEWKHKFFDDIMGDPLPINALHKYTVAFGELAKKYAPELWDEKALRTSVLDSIPFLGTLLFFSKYRKAIVNAIKLRMALILDKPRCEHGL